MKIMRPDNKRMLFTFYAVISSLVSFSQDTNQTLSQISIAVIMPDSLKGMPLEAITLLESRVIDIVTNSGIAADNPTSQSFVIYPIFSINSKQVVNGGMMPLHIASGSLTLAVKQFSSNIIFATITKRLRATGADDIEAENNIFNQIKPSDQDFIDFIQTAKNKIINYYKQSCNNIIKKAEADHVQKKYQQALATLLTIPVEAGDCYDKAQIKAVDIYNEMMKYSCSKFLLEAKTFAAGSKYDLALERISWIDPTLPCSAEAKTLINSIGSKVDAENKKKWDLLFKVYEGKIEIAKAQAQAMNSLATAWLLNQPQRITYDAIIH